MLFQVYSAPTTTVNLVAADLPKGGTWRICYCADDDGCNAAEDFGSQAGTLTVRGSLGVETFHCVKEVPCSIDVQGTDLAPTNRILTIPNQGLCSQSVATTYVTPQPSGSGGSAAQKSFSFGMASVQGIFTVCYCPT